MQRSLIRFVISYAYYDFKSHSSGLKYEFAMSIRRPAIIWKRGPYPASVHDITIYRGGKSDENKEDWEQNSLYFRTGGALPGGGGKGVGDSGYNGVPEKIIITKDGQSKQLKEFLARVKNRVYKRDPL